MPDLKHQSIVQILRDEPQLLVMFLGRSGFLLPSGAFPVIADSDLSHRTPRMLKELRSDNVFLFQGMDEKVAVARHARQELEQLMEDLFKDPFIDRFLEEGKVFAS